MLLQNVCTELHDIIIQKTTIWLLIDSRTVTPICGYLQRMKGGKFPNPHDIQRVGRCTPMDSIFSTVYSTPCTSMGLMFMQSRI
jgi:hypothetical protein